MKALVCIIAGMLFIASAAAHIYVRIRLRPKDADLDEWYHEFEEQHAEYARYLKWSKITLSGVIISMLLLFITLVI